MRRAGVCGLLGGEGRVVGDIVVFRASPALRQWCVGCCTLGGRRAAARGRRAPITCGVTGAACWGKSWYLACGACPCLRLGRGEVRLLLVHRCLVVGQYARGRGRGGAGNSREGVREWRGEWVRALVASLFRTLDECVGWTWVTRRGSRRRGTRGCHFRVDWIRGRG